MRRSRDRRGWRLAALLICLLAVGGSVAGAPPAKRVIVLGIDGMDYTLTARLLAEGRLPNLAKLAAQGGFQALGTSVPPLSPVAWSDFITGLDSGGHGIYDFMHRHPDTMIPYLSTSQPAPGGRTLEVGNWEIPLGGGGYELLRRGKPFWEALEEHGVETSIVRIPANFPPSGTASYEISGMGTPDVTGSYGIFSFYTSELFFEKRDVAGGEIRELDYWDGVARGELVGPPNPFRKDGRKVKTEFRLYVDTESQAAKLVVGDEERILEVGGWTDWVPFEFDFVPKLSALPGMSVPVMARFYLRRVEPEVELYASPINFDPMGGALPISTPEDFGEELAEATGRYYSQGMPEDTQALKGKVLTRDEFLAQARIASDELEGQLDYFLDRFRSGLLFYYFGNIDMVSHMLWGAMDPEHPAYDAERDAPYANTVIDLYERADGWVGKAMARVDDDTTLIVMSDHGFTSWRRTFDLNGWLRENGYLAVRNPNLKKDPGLFLNVDWSRTRAYGLGLNGLYLNLRGRERDGVVDPAAGKALVDEIAAKLLQVVDPATGKPAITKVYKRDEYYKDRGYLEVGPEIVVGYAHGTRGASSSALGGVGSEVLSDNLNDWSGDHGMDHTTVPGVLFSNRPLRKEVHALTDLASAIVAEFGVEGFPEHGAASAASPSP